VDNYDPQPTRPSIGHAQPVKAAFVLTAEESEQERQRRLGAQLLELTALADGLSDSAREIMDGAMEIVDDRRWALALSMLRAADHELGRAVR